MTRKLSAMMLAAALIAACGGGSNNSDNSANNPANNDNNANNANNANNQNNQNNDGDERFWTANITGLEDSEDITVPADLGGPVFKAQASLSGEGNTEDPPQVFRITTSAATELDSTGEKQASLLISWGDPLVECISNLANPVEIEGATLTITAVGPISGTYTADIDCYVGGDTANAVSAQVSGQVQTFGFGQ